MKARAAVVLAVVAALAAGCGDDEPTPSGEGVAPTTAVAPATAPDATVPTTATTTPTATTGVPKGGATPTTPTTTTGGESGEGGAGDEEAVRVPVALTLGDNAFTPSIVTVPAFLTLEVTVTSSRSATVTISAPGGGTLAVPAGGTATKRLAGLKAGDYSVTAGGGAKTTLHVVNGGDPGP